MILLPQQQLQTVLKNNKGLTLIEVMISLVVLLLVFLALMQTALVSIESNMTNVLRDEAVNIAEEKMNDARNTDFDSLTVESQTVLPTEQRSIRNIAAFSYTVKRTVNDVKINSSKQVDITVEWIWKNNPYKHQISAILRKQ